MSELSKLENIGKVLEKRLGNVGISNSEELAKEGSKQVFTKLYLFEGDTCFSTLCALEGAIKGVRWHYLSEKEKVELKEFFDIVSTGKKSGDS